MLTMAIQYIVCKSITTALYMSTSPMTMAMNGQNQKAFCLNGSQLIAEILNIPYFSVNYTAENKDEALDLINNPKHIIGMNQGAVSPYIIMFADSVGDSPLTGGVSLVLGYEYPEGSHGAQLLIKYNKLQTRGKIEKSWSDWVDIK